MNLYKRAAVVLAASLLGASMSSGTAGAATAKDVCGWTRTPDGWIEVKYWDSFRCGSTGGGLYNTKRITDTSGVDAGGTVSACTYSPVPTGFHITRYSSTFDCNRTRGTSEYHNQVGLVKLTGLRKGTTKTICGLFQVPTGWTVVSQYKSMDCQWHMYGYPANDNTMLIRKS